MQCSGPLPEISALDRVEIVVESWRWGFAHARAAEIASHFAARQRERPALWNGRVLLLHRFAVENGVLRGASFETDYANFLAWRDWGCPDAGVFNVFAAAALQAADGAFLVGRMAPFTSIAGQWLFPCGTPDPKDVRAGMLDLAGSARRELFEETGLEIRPLGVLEIFERIIRDASGAPEYHYVLIDYICRVTGGKLCAGDDVCRVEWVRRRDLKKLSITEGTLAVIEKGYRKRRIFLR